MWRLVALPLVSHAWLVGHMSTHGWPKYLDSISHVCRKLLKCPYLKHLIKHQQLYI